MREHGTTPRQCGFRVRPVLPDRISQSGKGTASSVNTTRCPHPRRAQFAVTLLRLCSPYPSRLLRTASSGSSFSALFTVVTSFARLVCACVSPCAQSAIIKGANACSSPALLPTRFPTTRSSHCSKKKFRCLSSLTLLFLLLFLAYFRSFLQKYCQFHCRK